MKIYTWGYSTNRALDDLLAALREDGWCGKTTPCLVDVRRSRKSRNPLWDLDGSPIAHPRKDHDTIGRLHGVRYIWADGLGNQGSTPRWVRHPLWEKHIGMIVGAMPGGNGPVQFAGPWILVCAEKDHRKCHRTEVAEELAKLTDAEVVHLP